MSKEILKLELEDLNIVYLREGIEQAIKNNRSVFAVTKVIQLVAERDSDSGRPKLKGLIASKDLQSLNDNLEDIMNKSPYILTKYDETAEEQLYEQAQYVLNHTNYYLIPVIDEEDNLLYAYQECNHNVQKFIEAAKPRYTKNAILYLYEYHKKNAKYSKLYIMSDIVTKKDNKFVVEKQDIPGLEEGSLVVLGYENDYTAQEIVGELIKYNIGYQAYVHMDNNRKITSYFNVDRYAKEALYEIAKENGNYFDYFDFQCIFQAISATKELPGAYIEIGTYKGDSAKAALTYMDMAKINRKVFCLDTYEGFNYEEAARSNDRLWENSHADTSISLVWERLEKFVPTVELIKSNIITDDIPKEIGEIVICNIDVDMYEAVDSALLKVKDRIVKGGIIIAEDYGHTPQLIGAQYAVQKFINEYHSEFIPLFLSGSQMFLIKR